MLVLLVVLGAWAALSVPVTLVVGRVLASVSGEPGDGSRSAWAETTRLTAPDARAHDRLVRSVV